MKQAQIDYLNWRYALKSNLVKGTHTLRSILADNAQARMFAENPAAVAVVLSYDKQNPDKNAEELYELLTQSSVAELASTTYICSTYGVADFGELFADEEIMAKVLADEASMNAIAASETAMSSIANDANAMANVAASEVAMTAVNGSATASEIVAGSSIALRAIASSEIAMTIVAGNETIVNAMVNDAAAMGSVASSTASTNALVAVDSAQSAIVGSSAAMNAITANSGSRNIVLASDSTMKKVYASEAASAKLVAGICGLTPSSYSAFGGIVSNSSAMSSAAGSESAMEIMAHSASALNVISKNSTARTAWLGSSYAHAYYDAVYETLHNAPASLFTKYETYYGDDSYYASDDVLGYYVDGTLYTNTSGGWTETSTVSATHSAAVPFAGITLLKKVFFTGSGTNDSFSIFWGSSQTKKTLVAGTWTKWTDAYLVLPGGASFYNTAGAYYGKYCHCCFATYVAV